MDPLKKQSLGIIGFGSFGQFIAKHLLPHFDISVTDHVDHSASAKEFGMKWGSLSDVASSNIVVLCVPVQFLEQVLQDVAPLLTSDAVVVDVSSVKVKPMELMQKYLPQTVQLLGTHPLFGPQSGKNGIAGMNIVLCPLRFKYLRLFDRFLSKNLGLTVLYKTADEHDFQMAYVQALTHFIGRAVNNMNIPDMEEKTVSYQNLLTIKNNLGKDSWDLFKTIELENPYAKQIREQFLTEIQKIHGLLE